MRKGMKAWRQPKIQRSCGHPTSGSCAEAGRLVGRITWQEGRTSPSFPVLASSMAVP